MILQSICHNKQLSRAAKQRNDESENLQLFCSQLSNKGCVIHSHCFYPYSFYEFDFNKSSICLARTWKMTKLLHYELCSKFKRWWWRKRTNLDAILQLLLNVNLITVLWLLISMFAKKSLMRRVDENASETPFSVC